MNNQICKCGGVLFYVLPKRPGGVYAACQQCGTVYQIKNKDLYETYDRVKPNPDKENSSTLSPGVKIFRLGSILDSMVN